MLPVSKDLRFKMNTQHMLTTSTLFINSMAFPTFLGGVGFDINCGVRLLRTNLDESDVQPVKEQLAQAMFDHIPVGVGSKGVIPMNAKWENDFVCASAEGTSLTFILIKDPSVGGFKKGKNSKPVLSTHVLLQEERCNHQCTVTCFFLHLKPWHN